MSDEIKAQYDDLEQVASRFSNQSQAIQEMITRVRSSMEDLQSGWKGRGSEAFFNEMQSEVLPASTRLHDVLADAGQVTREVVRTIQQAEEEASSLFSRSH
ncbi:MAG TPA: WXG100 family type VII secretion target [Chloroflexia bacterium]|jgi:WXG100 family type VII secretion target